MRQGDTISPKLFTACLEYVFKELEWEDYGVNINGEKLNHLKFADDLVLDRLQDAEQMLQGLQSKSLKVGLKINIEKAKVMIQ